MFSPPRVILPEEGGRIRARALSNVDLPQALGPRIAVIRPAGISRFTSRSTGTAPYPAETPSRRRAGPTYAVRRGGSSVMLGGEVLRGSR